MIVSKSENEYKVQYPDFNPVGVPEGAKLTINIDTSAFNPETALIGKWIRDNSNTYGIPNCWIFKRNGIIEFIGVQESSPKTKHKPRAGNYEIQVMALYKYAAEKTTFLYDTPPIDEAYLDRKTFDYLDIQSSLQESSFSYNLIAGWGRTRAMNMPTYFRVNWWNKFDGIVKILTRSTENDVALHSELMPVFYKQKYNIKPDTVVDDLRVISEIYVSEDETISLNELQGGLTAFLYSRYKNLWNYLIAETEGHAKRLRFTYRESGTSSGSYYIDRDIKFICYKDESIPTISLSDIIESKDGETIEEAENQFTESNNRNLLNRDKDVKKISLSVSSGSLAKSSFESTCVYGTAASTHAVFQRNQDNGKSIFTRIENNHLNVPCTQIYYYRDFGLGNQLVKISDYCRIYFNETEFIETDSTSYDTPFVGTTQLTLDVYNSNVNKLQSNGLAKLCNEINAEVLCKKQIWIEIVVMNNKISANDLGKEYRFDFHKLFKLNYFYDEITFGTRGVLVGIETNYVTGESKCKFFIRSDKWA
jgi:hypothetical protein